MSFRATLSTLAAALVVATSAPALRAQQPGDSLTLKRIFDSDEFSPARFGPARWLPDGGYTTVERSADVKGLDIVRYDPSSGRRTVLVDARRLIPEGHSEPLIIEDYQWSRDGSRLLVYTNSKRVWRYHTRGDYWVLDLKTGRLRQMGGDVPASTLMFAKFSPQGDRVAYVHDHDLYVERLSDGQITRLTRGGSLTLINGTFDWVYEEEFDDRDGFRWSPDGSHIAYWQIDASGERDFLLINDTDSLYPSIRRIPYPKVGTTLPAARVGVIPAAGGPTVWAELPGDPRNNYIPRMDWAADSKALVLQHMPRAQNTDDVMLVDAATGRARTVYSDHDSTWVDVVDDMAWLDGGKRFTWVSQKDGWRHVYVVSRDGTHEKLITPWPYDVV
ncbi:MAG TPA: DPP IV N-terminal domain-containing protein, partial [Longimicrobiales bacterium]|nr:DPP IV N-terminal domain-containing protein [Longimicrobiales bacterium]